MPWVAVASGLILFLGAACGLGGALLYRGRPPGWTDVVATDTVLRRVSLGLLATSALLLAAGVAGLLDLPGARTAGAAATLLFVAGGFWGNHAVFGSFRPAHTGTNVVLAAIVLWLLSRA